jgi:hypothetical protein
MARKKLRSPNKPPDRRIMSPPQPTWNPCNALFVNSLQTGFESDMRNFGDHVAAPHQIG